MSFKTKSLSQLIAEAQADIESRLPGSYARVAEKTLNAIAYAQGAATSGLQAQIAWFARQVIPGESDPEKLAEWCKAFNVPRKLASTASGSLLVTATGEATLPAGVRFQRPDGMTVEVTEDTITSEAGQISAPVVALEAGANGNTDSGVPFTIVTPRAGIQSHASCEGISGGADIETLSRWRSRLIFRFQYPPAGGTKYDYERWALECAGVTRAWVYKKQQGADVGVAFVMDDNNPIIPTASDVARVAKYIAGHRDPITNIWTGQPLGPEVLVFAPDSVPIDMTISIKPSTDAIKRAVTDAIASWFSLNIEPGGTLVYSELSAAISTTEGVTDSKIATPSGNIPSADGELLVPGDISWL
ncbi:baseplate J/gp47 family protein [Citrobacter braakii]|uniref:baseplate J/gp47 family protein n=1 Tax=Citrobacter braakii TaxID=57706 RepID=UPI00403A5EF5